MSAPWKDLVFASLMLVFKHWDVRIKSVLSGHLPIRGMPGCHVDNIPAELVQAGSEEVITALTTICNKIWLKGDWPLHGPSL